MQLFYFDIHDSKGTHRDDIGDEFGTLEEAIVQVRGLLPDLGSDDPPDSDRHTIICDLRDEKGHTAYQGEMTYRGIRFLN